MSATRHFTPADLATMPDDGQRYEVVGRELLVTPSPSFRHQAVMTQLLSAILPYLAAHGLSHDLVLAPADITLSDDTLVQPDLLVADTAAVRGSGRWTDVTALFLVVESPLRRPRGPIGCSSARRISFAACRTTGSSTQSSATLRYGRQTQSHR